MPVANDSNGSLACYYRAVGKPRRGLVGTPTSTTDCATLREAEELAEGLVLDGSWDEFYVKVIYRRRHAAVRS